MIDTETDVSTAIKSINGTLYVRRTQDVEPYLEANQAEYNNAPSWRPYAGLNMRHVANIPNIVIEKWMQEGVNVFDPSPEMQKKFAAKLNDYTNKKLRTYPGRVGWKA